MAKGITLVCQYTENMEDHWWCDGTYTLDINAVKRKYEICGFKCHEFDDQLSFL